MSVFCDSDTQYNNKLNDCSVCNGASHARARNYHSVCTQKQANTCISRSEDCKISRYCITGCQTIDQSSRMNVSVSVALHRIDETAVQL